VLEQRLRQGQVVHHNEDNREHDLLNCDDYYQFGAERYGRMGCGAHGTSPALKKYL
jgi:cobalamin biosynthesis Mg chelatase CobN